MSTTRTNLRILWSDSQQPDVRDHTAYGPAVEMVAEDDQGRMWALADDEPAATQINYNPFTGQRALTLCEGSSPSVPLPRSADEAALMHLMGHAYLRQNAPERLLNRAPYPPHDRETIIAGVGRIDYVDKVDVWPGPRPGTVDVIVRVTDADRCEFVRTKVLVSWTHFAPITLCLNAVHVFAR